MKSFLSVLFMIFIQYDGFLTWYVTLQEGSPCLTSDGSDGFCKNPFNCQWIRDTQLHENNWTICMNDDISIICCKDPLSTLNTKLDCHTNTANIFTTSLLEKCADNIETTSTMKPETSSTVTIAPEIITVKPEKIIDLLYTQIFVTREQCQALNEERVRLEKEANRTEGIAHGVNAEAGEFPFMATISLLDDSTSNHELVCGGSIITKRHILTAAHCIALDVEEFQTKALVKYGSIRLDEGFKEVKLAKPPTYYPGFRRSGEGFDIALLYLEDDIEIDADAFPVCLFHGNNPLERESNATIIGFGTMFGGNRAENLQKAQVNIKHATDCPKSLLQKPGYTGLKDNQICAGDSRPMSDTCRGDSGGPLLQTIDGVPTLVGITSFGQGVCDSNKLPSIYTRVSSFLEWIKLETEKDFENMEEIAVNLHQRIDEAQFS